MKPTFSAATVAGAVAHPSQRSSLVNEVFIRLIRIAARRSVSSSSFHRMKFDRKVFHLWVHNLFIIAIVHYDRVSVGAGFENDVVLFRETLVHESRQAIEVSERRHRPDGGVGDRKSVV